MSFCWELVYLKADRIPRKRIWKQRHKCLLANLDRMKQKRIARSESEKESQIYQRKKVSKVCSEKL
jgi:hypothetical protein